MRKIKEISMLTGWSDAYIRFLNTEIRRAGYNLIGTHEGMCLSDSLADRHYQVEKMLKQARDMEKTAEMMLKGEHQELSEDAAALLALYPHKSIRSYEIPEQTQFDFIEVRDGKIV